jgi:hypothetical protein
VDFTNCDADGAPRLLRIDEASLGKNEDPLRCRGSIAVEADDGQEHLMEKDEQEQKVVSSEGDQDTDFEESESTGGQEDDEDLSETEDQNLLPLYMYRE